MNASDCNFVSMISSVVPSQESEVILGKQPILAIYGQEVRNALGALPPEISRALTSEYREPSAGLLQGVERVLIARELAPDGAAQEASLDREWLANGGSGRGLEEGALSAEDSWNAGGVP
jgi:hypothetical protein